MLHFGTGKSFLLWTVLKSSQKVIFPAYECLGKCGLSTLWPDSNYESAQNISITQDTPHPVQEVQLCSPLAATVHSQKETVTERDRNSEDTNLTVLSRNPDFWAIPQGCVSGQKKMPSAPSPTHTAPAVQVVLALLHFPTARVAAVYQAVGSEVHAINLYHQSLHLLV